MRFLPIPFPKKTALRLLQIQLPLILLWSIALLIRFLTDYQVNPVGAAFRAPEQLEYIAASLLISIGTAVVADLCEREYTED